MSKRSDVYLAVPITKSHSAINDIRERVQIASRMADRHGLKQVVACLALAVHLLEEEARGRGESGA